jgi:hypothetical protein
MVEPGRGKRKKRERGRDEGRTVVDKGSNDLRLGPLGLSEELLSKAVPSRLVRRLDLGKGRVGGVEKGVKGDDVTLDGFRDGGESFESSAKRKKDQDEGRRREERDNDALSLEVGGLGDTLLLSDLLCGRRYKVSLAQKKRQRLRSDPVSVLLREPHRPHGPDRSNSPSARAL